jgi:hypothetical protein
VAGYDCGGDGGQPEPVHRHLCDDDQRVSPSSGPIGATVTITGSGFGGINSVRPAGAPVGTTVSNTGHNLAGVTQVSLCLVPATSFSVVSHTTIDALVPAKACNGYWRATSPNGTDVSPTPFTVG